MKPVHCIRGKITQRRLVRYLWKFPGCSQKRQGEDGSFLLAHCSLRAAVSSPGLLRTAGQVVKYVKVLLPILHASSPLSDCRVRCLVIQERR